jgi:hypothetical protein
MKRAQSVDPFREDTPARLQARFDVLGGDFVVTAADARLLDLAVEAFGALPQQQFSRQPLKLEVRLLLSNQRQTWRRGSAPPSPLLSAGAGLLCATIDAGNFAVVDVPMSRALISVSRAMLEHPYYARYELIELAFLTLAARAQSLVPLHAACVGANGKGVLLMGASGTGKSTLSLHALAGGLQVLSEDSAFVAPESLRITGVANYLHVVPNALTFLQPGALRQTIESSRIIRRRSGTRKFEVDLRELRGPRIRGPLRLSATVFLSRRTAGAARTLEPLEPEIFIRRLRREQPYALGRSNWSEFERRVVDVPSYELRRTEHPAAAVLQLQSLLESSA